MDEKKRGGKTRPERPAGTKKEPPLHKKRQTEREKRKGSAKVSGKERKEKDKLRSRKAPEKRKSSKKTGSTQKLTRASQKASRKSSVGQKSSSGKNLSSASCRKKLSASPPDFTKQRQTSSSLPRKFRPSLGTVLRYSIKSTFWLICVLVLFLGYQTLRILPLDMSKALHRKPTISVTDIQGKMLGTRSLGHRQDIVLADLPPYLPLAVIAIEDRRFYKHFGIDLIGLTRATLRNILKRNLAQGGSTLTQQLAKNLFLKPEKTFQRKIREAIIAIWLETRYSKDQILEMYLNQVYFGAGAHGIEQASWKFFGKSASDLSLPESAFLAGMVKAPSRYAASTDSPVVLHRYQQVLTAMYREQFISESTYQKALPAPPRLAENQQPESSNYVVDWVRSILSGFIGTPQSDVIVETTIDSTIQSFAEQSLYKLLEQEGSRKNVQQGALVALDHQGAIKALVGGKSYRKSAFNRAVKAFRQPGSAFKPFLYLTAIENGALPEDLYQDVPTKFGDWMPANYRNLYNGTISLREGLARSSNVIAVTLAQKYGVKKVIQTARRLGISSPLKTDLSIALGTSEVHILELTSAFIPFANGGYGVVPRIIDRISNRADGKILYERTGSGPGRVLAANHAALMHSMLQDTVMQGTAKQAQILGLAVAGKTGTTQDFRDAWFVGYTDRIVATVWVGNDQNHPMKQVSGGTLPARIWRDFVRKAHWHLPDLVLLNPAQFQHLAQISTFSDAQTGKEEEEQTYRRIYQWQKRLP